MTKDEAIKTLNIINNDIIKDTLMKTLLTQVILIVEAIKEQPEIVRCEDCKHFGSDARSTLCGKTKMYVKREFYCKYGEKNE